MVFRIIILFILLNSLCDLRAQTLFSETNGDLELANTVVATIDTIAITSEEFFYSYEFGPAFPKRQKNSKEVHLNFMIYEKLLALEGYANGIFEKSEPKNIYSDFHSDLATEELFKNEILTKIKVSNYELEEVVKNKNTELELRWIFAHDKDRIDEILSLLNDKKLFDSLFSEQLNDSIFADQRQMKTSMYNLKKNNKTLANIIGSLEVGEISTPIQTAEGWYIVKYDNKIISLISNESERNKMWNEAKKTLTVHKMDSISDNYVNSLLFENSPIIKRDVFSILRSYLAKYILTENNYKEWELDKKKESALNNLGLFKDDNYSALVLVESKNTKVDLAEFIAWYKNRAQYIKLNKAGLKDFSISLENTIWQMLRDKLLSQTAMKKKYFNNNWVKNQSKWWRDKIVYAALRNEYANSITLENNEIVSQESNVTEPEMAEKKLTKKILHKVLELKNKYKIEINKNLLDKISVSAEHDKKTVDLYTIKKGGLIPRPAYPSIDNEWSTWQ